jgi:hypothetical protein
MTGFHVESKFSKGHKYKIIHKVTNVDVCVVSLLSTLCFLTEVEVSYIFEDISPEVLLLILIVFSQRCTV